MVRLDIVSWRDGAKIIGAIGQKYIDVNMPLLPEALRALLPGLPAEDVRADRQGPIRVQLVTRAPSPPSRYLLTQSLIWELLRTPYSRVSSR